MSYTPTPDPDRYLITAEADAVQLICTDCQSLTVPDRFRLVRSDQHGVVSARTIMGWMAAHDVACHFPTESQQQLALEVDHG